MEYALLGCIGVVGLDSRRCHSCCILHAGLVLYCRNMKQVLRHHWFVATQLGLRGGRYHPMDVALLLLHRICCTERTATFRKWSFSLVFLFFPCCSIIKGRQVLQVRAVWVKIYSSQFDHVILHISAYPFVLITLLKVGFVGGQTNGTQCQKVSPHWRGRGVILFQEMVLVHTPFFRESDQPRTTF